MYMLKVWDRPEGGRNLVESYVDLDFMQAIHIAASYSPQGYSYELTKQGGQFATCGLTTWLGR